MTWQDNLDRLTSLPTTVAARCAIDILTMVRAMFPQSPPPKRMVYDGSGGITIEFWRGQHVVESFKIDATAHIEATSLNQGRVFSRRILEYIA